MRYNDHAGLVNQIMGDSAEKRLERYTKQIEELKRKSKAAEKEIKAKERKQRSTMLVAYGLLVLDELKRGIRSEAELKTELDRVLTQPSHRIAVGLPAHKDKQPKAEAKKPAAVQPPAKTTKTKKRILETTDDAAIAKAFEDA